ncbi:SdrD B-like domain-containing protein [Conexibacter woesei]|uniref:Conserved repeat domain protein n=1 Tax=Conexibacter woesei (strain DSM 14684 / CCUG 47730 / CIP 108061 / JCM 11494 / NBRC 100937 / ID131577) TaxID=469383 RepID=D3F6E3_CONWI|nr:SdrD B-like domain-containing protein [Conexibacter woesei]ADB50710.1 conserved repeat domain protein [Conexibacter woesei DSM 14684]
MTTGRSHPTSPVRRWWRAPLIASALLLTLPALAAAAPISGTAFEDFNDNGTRDSSPAVDSGVGGITVTAYGADGGAVASATTAADGTYTLNVPDGAGRVRVEFTGLPAGYQPARHGTNSGTTVQFATGPASGVDVGVLQPANYCQDNPLLAIACQRFGAHDGRYGGDATIRLVSDDTPDQTQAVAGGELGAPIVRPGALFSQTGAIFGIAQPTASNYLYSSAYTKRHSDWGPGGAGAIYRTDVAQATAGTPNASVFFDVNSLPGNPAGGGFVRGADRTGADVREFFNDSLAWDAVGSSGLGNLSSTDDGSELYTVGLASGELIRVPVPADGSRPASAQAYAIPRAACANPADARPMATAVHDGLVYVGGVCSEASRGDPPPQTASADLRLFVYTFDPATGAFGASPVLNQTLESRRLCVIRSGAPVDPFPSAACTNGISADWHPWTSQSTRSAIDVGNAGRYPQPMLADISFVGDDLVLGIRDRSPDQVGVISRFPNGDPGEVGMQSGYTLRACPAGAAFQLESNGVCGGLTASGPKNVAQWGPGGSLFYWYQNYNSFSAAGGAAHDYGGQGGTLQIPGYADLRQASGYGANRCAPGSVIGGCPATDGPSGSSGVLYLSNSDGSRTRGFNLYTGGGDNNVVSTFGKANGLGDLEALCDAAPIEIGNYVWLDPDRDGAQDPSEAAIGDVLVELLDGSGNVIATTRTDANGQYWFNESNVPGAIQPNTDYTVRIPLGQAPLAQYTPTNPDTDAQLRDSDGIPSGAFVVDRLRTGAAGHNDHTHDFGFVPPFNVSIRKAVSSPTAKIGDTITYRLTARNDGPAVSNDVLVTDNLPEQLQLTGARTSKGSCTTSGNTVRCQLGRLQPGQTETITVTAIAHRSGTAINNAEISSPGDRDPRDNRDRREVRIPEPDLSIVKTASAPTVRLGETVTYTLVARNNGPGLARDVVVTDRLPDELQLTGVRTPVGECTRRGDNVRCELGTLSERQQVRITVTAKAVKAGRTVNVGVVEVPPPPRTPPGTPPPPRDPKPRNNRDGARVVVRRVDLGLTKSVDRTVLRAGQRATYTIKVRNPSRRVALRNVRTCDDLPKGLVFVKATPKAKLSKGRYCWTAKVLKPGQSKTYRLTVRALRGTGGTRVNRAVATAPDANTRRANRAVRVIGGGIKGGGVTG